MQCPKCNAYGLACSDSRPYNETIRRRRRCMNCGYRFSTVEISVEDYRKLKDKEPETEALIADMLSYLDDFYQKLNERKASGNDEMQD